MAYEVQIAIPPYVSDWSTYDSPELTVILSEEPDRIWKAAFRIVPVRVSHRLSAPDWMWHPDEPEDGAEQQRVGHVTLIPAAQDTRAALGWLVGFLDAVNKQADQIAALVQEANEASKAVVGNATFLTLRE